LIGVCFSSEEICACSHEIKILKVTARTIMHVDAFPVKVKDLAKPDIATITRPSSEDEALTILEHFDRIFRQPHEEK